MTSFGKFTLRFAAYGVVLLYIAADLFLFHGPLYNRIEASRLDSAESIAAARARGVVAFVYGREITLAQIDHAVAKKLTQSGGPLPDAIPPDQLRLHRYAALGDLIDHELLRVKVMHASTEFPVDDAEIDTAIQRIASRFPDADAFDQALADSGTTREAHRARIAARIQQIKFTESRVDPLASPADAQLRQRAAADFQKALRDFEAKRDRILIHHELMR